MINWAYSCAMVMIRLYVPIGQFQLLKTHLYQLFYIRSVYWIVLVLWEFSLQKNYFKSVKKYQNAFHAKRCNSRRKRFFYNIKPESESSRSRLHKYLNHFSSIFDLWWREFFCWKFSLHLQLLIFYKVMEWRW